MIGIVSLNILTAVTEAYNMEDHRITAVAHPRICGLRRMLSLDIIDNLHQVVLTCSPSVNGAKSVSS